MSYKLIPKLSPEEEELERKKVELGAIEAELAERELEWATLQVKLRTFEQRYLRIVGIKYAELDEIRAEIAEYLAQKDPENPSTQTEAKKAWARAKETRHATSEAQANKALENPDLSEDLKKLYREAAKKVHPDLALDETERQRRTQLMAELNRAYQSGDRVRIRSILDDWEGRPEAIKGEGVATELVRVIRKVAQARKRLALIANKITELLASDVAKLMSKVDTAAADGRDLLAEMASLVDDQIRESRSHLAQLRADGRVG